MTDALEVSRREWFCAALWSGPLLRGDAIVVLAGEDAEPRLTVGVELLTRGAAPLLVLSGGVERPPRQVGARTLAPLAMARGVAPDRLVLEQDSQNTHEQAVAVMAMAAVRGWQRLLLVASPYHLPRAFLTFLRALQALDSSRPSDALLPWWQRLHVLPVPTSHTPWWGKPDGAEETRLDLLSAEFDKIVGYGAHVASFEEGLAYLQHWEGR